MLFSPFLAYSSSISEGNDNPLDYFALQAPIGRFEGSVSDKIFAKYYTCRLGVAAIAILVSFSPNKSSKAICSSCSSYIRKVTYSFTLSPSSNLSCSFGLKVGL